MTPLDPTMVYGEEALPRTAANGTSPGLTGGTPRWLNPGPGPGFFRF